MINSIILGINAATLVCSITLLVDAFKNKISFWFVVIAYLLIAYSTFSIAHIFM